MNSETIQRLSATIDELGLRILGPLRMSKTIPEASLQELHETLEKLGEILASETCVPKALAGNLWFIFTSMLAEAQHAKDRRQVIETAAWNLQEKLQKIFGPQF